MKREEILALLDARREDLCQHGVRFLFLFGSVARGEADAGSDVDLLVEFDRPVGLFAFLRLKRYLENLLGTEVDLVMPGALEEPMKERVLREAIRAA